MLVFILFPSFLLYFHLTLCKKRSILYIIGSEKGHRKMGFVKLDVHTHTIASGHATTATITDMAKSAAANNLTLLGISDHGPATFGGGKPSYFRSLSHAQKERFGIEMLYGAEVSILNTGGKLDLEDSVLKKLDYVIASIHMPIKKPGTVDENTATYISAMKNPYVRIIGHCDDERYPIDHLALVRAAMEHHVLLEINNSSLSPDGYRGDTRFNALMILNLCSHFHYPVLLSSDSHGAKHIGDCKYAQKMAKLAEVPDGLILNYSPSKFKSFLAERTC